MHEIKTRSRGSNAHADSPSLAMHPMIALLHRATGMYAIIIEIRAESLNRKNNFRLFSLRSINVELFTYFIPSFYLICTYIDCDVMRIAGLQRTPELDLCVGAILVAFFDHNVLCVILHGRIIIAASSMAILWMRLVARGENRQWKYVIVITNGWGECVRFHLACNLH